MSEAIVFVNGEYVPESEARISVFDRGFLFADGVYEVTSVIEGGLVDNAGHLVRLRRSLGEIGMSCPMSDEEITLMQKNLIERNQLEQGMIYLQVSRGAAPRDFAFPVDTKPSIVAFTQSRNVLSPPVVERGLTVVTLPDIRWRRRDIKTVGLLPASMAKQRAAEQGADDAWMVEDGYVTEGTSNNAYIIDREQRLITRPLSSDILPGITRKAILALAEESGMEILERSFTPEEAYQAQEAFVSSATTFVMPVVSIDGHAIGDGKPGPVVKRLRELYIDFARRTLS
ncbi:D-amino acid aminotransferase [Hahella sp. CCB-MM4]|uniref:D-amino-acid transaminase n=1 Tax=Hahella sp. (strain CCB-MM4) TaxID=1926491 RepID=UPI000B9A2AB0|nr:D-amino-acid transaminase [Hahella sp. CCB-MM4]OZG74451.1 D-amino acid aminotransferase [Hahella sp. CCB-MM4]